MEHARLDPPATRTISIEVDEELASLAETLNLDLAATCRRGFDAELRRERQQREWQDKHRDVIEATNAWVEKNGLPLAKYRLF